MKCMKPSFLYRKGRLLSTLPLLTLGLSTACVEGTEVGDGGGVDNNFQEVSRGVSGGVSFPAQWADYSVIGASDRLEGENDGDDSTIVLVLGNDVAVTSAQNIAQGVQTTWTEGSIIARVVWRDIANPTGLDNGSSQDTLGPVSFVSLTAMEKDPDRFSNEGGWGYGLWAGNTLTSRDTNLPIVANQTCDACHNGRVGDAQDYVFTPAIQFPAETAFQNAQPSSNIALPVRSFTWKFIGVHKRFNGDQIRVILGNDVAVGAARAANGNVISWPEGSQIADFVFAGGSNDYWRFDDDTDRMTNTDSFAALAYMEKNSDQYPAENGGWGYGFWAGPQLDARNAAEDPIVNNETCSDCHNREVSGNDYVFTVPGPLPASP
ncbi:MAG: cytochrome P460 family protein [Myxococcales bacterium]|nr:cytochrome P460 family protein [Myxococcales bacterium]